MGDVRTMSYYRNVAVNLDLLSALELRDSGSIFGTETSRGGKWSTVN